MTENKLFEDYGDMDTETLVNEVKYSRNLTSAQEGLYILQIMKNEGFTRHKEAADLIGVSRSYVSLRIKAAKDLNKNTTPTRSVGRPKHHIIDLDEIHGDKVPLRITSKIGDISAHEMSDLLLQHIVYLNKENREEIINNIVDSIIRTKEYSKEEIIGYLKNKTDTLANE